jgi:biotin-dependent carboxylase-like uncharacterized protein
MTRRLLAVRRAGTLTTVQDQGRPGWAHIAVPRSGALDAPAAALANRLVGNPATAAVLETTVDGVAVELTTGGWVSVTGAWAPVTLDGRPAAWSAAVRVPPGGTVEVGPAHRGVRSYLAVDGGLAVPAVLGSRSTDLLSGLGPAPLRDGDRLPLGPAGSPRHTDAAGAAAPPDTTARLRLLPVPRHDWLTPSGAAMLTSAGFTVSSASNRVAVRLCGPPLERRDGELPSEGTVTGGVQLPADGQPLIFLADHPTTVGYPVVAVIDPADLWLCAQLRPGATVTFTVAPGRS